MMDGFVRTAVATPEIRVADPDYNAAGILDMIREADRRGAELIVFPELCLTAYTCADLFLETRLLDGAKEALDRLTEGTRGTGILSVVGLPMAVSGKLYNVAAFLMDGRVLALVPKKNLPNYGEFQETRWFTPGEERVQLLQYTNEVSGEEYQVPFGMNILVESETVPDFRVACEICEDVWVPVTPSTAHSLAGAMIVVNPSASDEVVGKDSYRRSLIQSTSARLVCAYLYANAGEGESTQDLVFGGQSIIAENGTVLAESRRFTTGIHYADLDLDRLRRERLRMNTYPAGLNRFDQYVHVGFRRAEPAETEEGTALPGLLRFVDPHPFVPDDAAERAKRCEEILTIQALGLKKRLQHIHCETAVIGISGGLDSTLALLVIARAFDMLKLPRKNILSVTMPAFGTTDRTYRNAVTLTHQLGATLREINIRAAVLQHFADIGHDPENHNVVYENAQARERTQILMDLANAENGLVIGTGDLSELALGWATYNGDHMSMYGVNGSIPKTLVRHLVRYAAEEAEKSDPALAEALRDVLDTPVSPELLPPTEDGKISQKTEDLVGPYELHDFFLYQVLRNGFTPRKVYALALHAFSDENLALRGLRRQQEEQSLGVHSYDAETILKWLKKFYWRFFSQQYKRSCLPDGPKVGSVSVSPRGDLRMPSDAVVQLWLDELEELS